MDNKYLYFAKYLTVIDGFGLHLFHMMLIDYILLQISYSINFHIFRVYVLNSLLLKQFELQKNGNLLNL